MIEQSSIAWGLSAFSSFECRHAADKERRLSILGCVELFCRAFETDLREIVVENLVRPIEQFARGGKVVAHFLPHADELCTLPWE